jgi:hypothetical protein
MPTPKSRTSDGTLFSGFFFYCEDEDEVKRLAMHLVVDRDKYQKAKKTKHSWM